MTLFDDIKNILNERIISPAKEDIASAVSNLKANTENRVMDIVAETPAAQAVKTNEIKKMLPWILGGVAVLIAAVWIIAKTK